MFRTEEGAVVGSIDVSAEPAGPAEAEPAVQESPPKRARTATGPRKEN